MKQDERKALIGKYILLILGSVLILVPLLATLFSSFKPTKDIVDNFFGWDRRLLLELCRHHCLVFTCSNDLYPHGSLLHRT